MSTVSSAKKLYVRKPLINDVVAAFTRGCRSTSRDRYKWTYPVMEVQFPGGISANCPPELLIPFIAYATSHCINYIYVCSQVVGIASWLSTFNELEQDYALYIFEKYYVIPTRQIGKHKPYLSGYLQQRLSGSSELSEYD